MQLQFNAPSHHILEEGEQVVNGGESFDVTDERAAELLADPEVNVSEADPSDLLKLPLKKLHELAEAAGVENPTRLRSKAAVIAAIEQPTADGAGHESEQEN